MFKKKLELIFASVIVLAISVLALNYYKSYTFKNNDIPESYKQRIQAKEQEVLYNMQRQYGFTLNIPLIVTDKFKGRLYGLTSYKNGEIKIYLNKKVMQESMDYMIESVIAHEYAHALMFKQGHMHTKDDGHSKLWQQTCIKLGAKDCQQYVDQQEIIMSKMPF
ncbi:MAG: SprT protein [Sulfurimonas sp.]|jgi:SprT protein|uniref:SprT-like domain-containing protein n=1 Tax=Sulfurimonas sp. TaxID=2022749 RepID=UPI0039E4F906